MPKNKIPNGYYLDVAKRLEEAYDDVTSTIKVLNDQLCDLNQPDLRRLLAENLSESLKIIRTNTKILVERDIAITITKK